jgi:hypothetical protein
MSRRVHHGYAARRADVLLVDDGVDSVLVPPDEERTHLLNPTARAIWELCDGQTDAEEMAAAICQVFAVSWDDAMTDVARALNTMTEVGLVEWRPRQGATA